MKLINSRLALLATLVAIFVPGSFKLRFNTVASAINRRGKVIEELLLYRASPDNKPSTSRISYTPLLSAGARISL